MQKRLYKLSFKNIKELNNISLNFNDVKNILNSEISLEKTGRTVINSNPDLTYEINDEKKQKEINSFLSDQIIKIQKRKKVIFEVFIKNKDSLLEKKEDNREADYLISVLDFYNFFGKENIVIESNNINFEDQYNEISKIITDKLYNMYEKRIENYKNKDYKFEYEKMSQKINSKIENQKKEIIQSYIFMKIFNYIKEKFEYDEPCIEKDKEGNTKIIYKRKKFLAEIPMINNLNLNFFENSINLNDGEQIKLIEKYVAKARLEFDKEKNTILIPEVFFGNKNNNNYEVSKTEIFKKLIFEKFEEIMSKSKVVKKEKEGSYYEVDIKLYNINIHRINLFNVVKSVVFKGIIDELRPYIVGIKNEKGNNIKKSIKLNDIEKISQIVNYKKEQIEILFKNEENKKSKNIISNDIRNDTEKEKYFKLIREVKKKIDNNLLDFERKNKDFSFNFKIKNIRKKENLKISDKIIAIFLEDIYNVLNVYKNFNLEDKNKKISEIINYKKVINKNQKEDETNDSKRKFKLDFDFLFIKVFINLSKKFTFVVPLLGTYGNNISDKFVTVAFFNNINNVNSFLENIVYNASDIHIIKDKYKIFKKNDIKKEMVFLNEKGETERKKVTYLEYLDYKYRKKYRINKKNPFEINSKNASIYGEMFSNSYKYHRILGENIKYLFININSNKELKINSLLFKNYKSFINSMLVLDGVINSGNRILKGENLGNENMENKDEIILKNYVPDSNEFDIYVNDRYIGTTHYNLDVNEGTQRAETIEQKLVKILSEI